ncbi:hypothetical protein H5410_032271 [Solanum commersonii]|uniref:Uncharacterized protein n=1 Tax=Solanum commersonii TaxID=4109 RepID=A0A9J5YLP5_SOLCO|nr:hypothetical protein H5410_032271 [Solanum commersonii]
MEHVLLTFCTHLGHAKLTGRGFCVLEFLESREVHQADLIFGSTLYFVVLMDRGTKDVLMAPHVPSLPLKQNALVPRHLPKVPSGLCESYSGRLCPPESSLFLKNRMDNRIYFRSEGKFYDIIESQSKAEIWYDWVESGRYHMRRMVLSKGALIWIGRRPSKASGTRGKSFKTWRCKDYSTSIFLSQKFNKSGGFSSLINN